MNNYEKSFIYKIVCKDLSINDCYVGSTTNFNSRRRDHKSNCNNPKIKKYNYKVYEFIRDNGGWDNWDMIMVEEFPCDNKLQLHRREREFIEMLNATLNNNIPTRTDKQYREDNKEKITQYRADNKEKMKQYSKIYYKDNKEKYQNNKEKMKQYRENNQEKIKQYRLDNKEKLKQKIECKICKCMIRKNNLNRHIKTKKHIDSLKQSTSEAVPTSEAEPNDDDQK